MKIAHLILAHNNPLQLERLVRRLHTEEADVYIHLDKKSSDSVFDNVMKLPFAIFIKNRIDVRWGEYSVIKATLAGMEEIINTGICYSHINLLSGNDYPIRNSVEIQNFFFTNKGKTFMWYDKIFNDWEHGQVRMNNYDFGDFNFPGRYLLTKIVNKIMPKRKMPANLVAYGRAQWLTITPEAVEYVLNYIKENPNIERFFRLTWCVDEIFFQTILCNSVLKDTLVNDNLRYVVLDQGFSPVVLTMVDAELLIHSGKFYARKFDYKKDNAVFDYLDNSLN